MDLKENMWIRGVGYLRPPELLLPCLIGCEQSDVSCQFNTLSHRSVRKLCFQKSLSPSSTSPLPLVGHKFLFTVLEEPSMSCDVSFWSQSTGCFYIKTVQFPLWMSVAAGGITAELGVLL